MANSSMASLTVKGFSLSWSEDDAAESLPCFSCGEPTQGRAEFQDVGQAVRQRAACMRCCIARALARSAVVLE